jgi:hypothetical protein
LDPECRDAQVDVTAGHDVQALQDRNVGGHADREGGHEDVPADHPGELQARQQHRIEIHESLR